MQTTIHIPETGVRTEKNVKKSTIYRKKQMYTQVQVLPVVSTQHYLSGWGQPPGPVVP